MGSTDISLGSSGQIGFHSVFRSGNTHTYTRPQQIPDSKLRSTPPLLFETLARSARSAGRLNTLPSVFCSGNTRTRTPPEQIPNFKTNGTQVRHHEPSWLF